MNGYNPDHPKLDESAFGESKALNAVQAFDAFPKTKPSYQEKTNTGGVWTVVLVCASLWLASTEIGRWWVGQTTHEFSVEQGVGHDLQINLDVVVKMRCDDLHVNVQDASGDRILAGQALQKDGTLWTQWDEKRLRLHSLGVTKDERMELSGYPGFGEYRDTDVHDYLGAAKHGGKKFARTPQLPRRTEPDSCRIYGSMHSNKVQGDFHITARGHGYMEFGQHLEHNVFNFTHHITELSFGPFYPSLTNPLDNTLATTPNNFYKFQYYLSVVPTIYTTDAKSLRKITKQQAGESPSSGSDGLAAHPKRHSKKTVFTNQYAVTEQSHPVAENAVPGVFVKYDIEPIMLTIAEEWQSLPGLGIRLVNVVSGVLVAGGWCYQLLEWWKEVRAKRRRGDEGGMLTPMVGKGEKNGLM
ncbi:hypothetical protein LTR56_009001 [Elasticomyces elasticus]|uniref:Endoplasmic reticulum-Golgi intermediate compartment protein n=1 Tax=Elasticomyces elasticus TaxID=574655 RepID=A0AAN7W309_9PEZI|nr:hypothetical protein LTR56_011600 [Elasticomyces elasticus]KAK3645561.1 hypothetical protein LTR56_009001 [Elasticomyces elasticus]KAK3656971.1 hypothetical protein LTR22_009472 [Elasticomyces elasticus]KAK3663802.1 hypothetical protein LTR22_005263 [Elasticomyces elasticus]KAK4896137.1 hypothetical protein LTR27_005994 [Elasticomyces elasticus]